jgi:hypothetical protein
MPPVEPAELGSKRRRRVGEAFHHKEQSGNDITTTPLLRKRTPPCPVSSGKTAALPQASHFILSLPGLTPALSCDAPFAADGSGKLFQETGFSEFWHVMRLPDGPCWF